MTMHEEIKRLGKLVPGPPLGELSTTGSGTFPSAFDVDTIAFAATGAANLAHGVSTLDTDKVVGAFVTAVDIDGEPLPTWADLSGLYNTRDGGWIQFHCNFDHHAAGVVARLGGVAERDAVQAAVLGWDPDELELTSLNRSDPQSERRLHWPSGWQPRQLASDHMRHRQRADAASDPAHHRRH